MENVINQQGFTNGYLLIYKQNIAEYRRNVISKEESLEYSQ